MSGSYHPMSPAMSEQHDRIGTASSLAGLDYVPLGDISKASDSKVSSTQNSQGWDHEEPLTTKLLPSRFPAESKTISPHLDRSYNNSTKDHTNSQRGEDNLRQLEDTLEDLEIHLPVLSEKELQSLDKEWHPSTQLRRLLFKGLVRWLATVMFVIVIYVVLYMFSKKPVMDDKNKKVSTHNSLHDSLWAMIEKRQAFNVLIVGSTLALGLNIASSLKAMAVDFRWWLLSHKKRSLKEVNLILHLDSLTEVSKLALTAPSLSLLCAGWLALNIVSVFLIQAA